MVTILAALTLGLGPLSPAAVQTRCAAAAASLQARTAAIARVRKRTFDDTVLALERAASDARDTLAASLFLGAVTSDRTAAGVVGTCRASLADAWNRVAAQPGLYAAVAAGARGGRSPADRRLAALWLRRLHSSGARLSPPMRAQYRALAKRLADARAQFRVNFAGATPTIEIPRGELAGLTPELLAAGVRRRNGSFSLPVDDGTRALLRYARSADLREAYYDAAHRRAAPQNVALLETAIGLRDRMAHLLGFESWFDLRAAGSALGPAGARRLVTASGAADRDAPLPSSRLRPWDVARERRLHERSEGFDERAARKYFPAPHVTAAALQLAGRLLGLRARRLSARVWAPGVVAYAVTDRSDDRSLGRLYLDLYRRGGKFERSAELTIEAAGAGHPAAAAVIEAWPRMHDGPLLDYDQVARFFAQLAFAESALLPQAPYQTLNRLSLASQATTAELFARIAWQPATIEALGAGSHAGSIAAATAKRMSALRGAGRARRGVRAAVVASIDLAYNASGPHVDTTAAWARIAGQMLPELYHPGTYPQVTTQVFMNRWDGRLYTRLLGRAYAADMSAMQSGAPIDSEAVMRYRRTVLEPARTHPLLREIQALLRHAPRVPGQ